MLVIFIIILFLLDPCIGLEDVKNSYSQYHEIILGVISDFEQDSLQGRLEPTFERYLNEVVGDALNVSLKIMYLDFNEVHLAIENRTIDLIYANSTVLPCLERIHAVSSIATLSRSKHGEAIQEHHGSFVVKKNSKIIHISEIIDKVVEATSANSLCEFQLQWDELIHHYVHIFRDPKQLIFSRSSRQTIFDLLSGLSDVGLVREDTLSNMARDGLINISDFRMLEIRAGTGASSSSHTRLSAPEWAIARMPWLHEHVAQQVATALFSIDPWDEVAVAGAYRGWCTPRSHLPIWQMQYDLGIVIDSGRCLPPDNIYSWISCPVGSMRMVEEEVGRGCQDQGMACPAGNTCVCKPCLQLPEVEIAVEMHTHHWLPSDSDGLDNPDDHQHMSGELLPAQGGWHACESMLPCTDVEQGDHVVIQFTDNWSIQRPRVDLPCTTWIQYDFRRANPKDMNENVDISALWEDVHEAEWLNATQINSTVHNSTTNSTSEASTLGSCAGTFRGEFRVPGVGFVLIKIRRCYWARNANAPECEDVGNSPFMLTVLSRECESQYMEADSQGACLCREGYLLNEGGECVEDSTDSQDGIMATTWYMIVGGVVSALLLALTLIAIVMIKKDFLLKMRAKEWKISSRDLIMCDPIVTLGRGMFGMVVLGELRGTPVVIKRALPLTSDVSVRFQALDRPSQVEIDCDDAELGENSLSSAPEMPPRPSSISQRRKSSATSSTTSFDRFSTQMLKLGGQLIPGLNDRRWSDDVSVNVGASETTTPSNLRTLRDTPNRDRSYSVSRMRSTIGPNDGFVTPSTYSRPRAGSDPGIPSFDRVRDLEGNNLMLQELQKQNQAVALESVSGNSSAAFNNVWDFDRFSRARSSKSMAPLPIPKHLKPLDLGASAASSDFASALGSPGAANDMKLRRSCSPSLHEDESIILPHLRGGGGSGGSYSKPATQSMLKGKSPAAAVVVQEPNTGAHSAGPASDGYLEKGIDHHSDIMECEETDGGVKNEKLETTNPPTGSSMVQHEPGAAETFEKIGSQKLHIKNMVYKLATDKITRRSTTRMETRKLRKELVREFQVLFDMRHPNITTFMGAVMEESSEPAVVLEYLPQGSLYNLLHNETMQFETETVMLIIKDIVAGMKFLHTQTPPFLHKDLRAGNVLIGEKFNAKLVNLGLATKQKLTGILGTPYWMAPELFHQGGEHSTKSDVYSFGVLLFEIFTRSEPYSEQNQRSVPFDEIIQKIISPEIKLRPTLPEGMPASVQQLISACWHPEPQWRPSFLDLQCMLEFLDLRQLDQWLQSRQQSSNARRRLGDREGKKTASQLLYDVFPPHIANTLKAGQKVEPEHHDCVTIYFSDIHQFQTISEQLPPLKVMDLLDRLYLKFDDLAREHDVFKVETIGDAYMAVSNLIKPQPRHAVLVAEFAMDAIRIANSTLIDEDDPSLGCVEIRVGFHSGPVVASVVGNLNPRFCLFGDTVNTASRMESNSEKNRIHVSESAAAHLKEQGLATGEIRRRGYIQVKGKSDMLTFWVKPTKISSASAVDRQSTKLDDRRSSSTMEIKC